MSNCANISDIIQLRIHRISDLGYNLGSVDCKRWAHSLLENSQLLLKVLTAVLLQRTAGGYSHERALLNSM